MGDSLFPYAYPIELVQLVFAFLGAGANLLGVLDSFLDFKYVIHSGLNGARRFVARKNVEDELLRLMVQALFIGIGVFSIVSPPPYDVAPLSTERFESLTFTRVMIALSSLILMLKSVKDNWERAKLRSMLEAQGGYDNDH